MTRLGEPGTGRPLQLRVQETSAGEPYNGILLNPDGDLVGRLERFRFRFVNLDEPTCVEFTGGERETPPAYVAQERSASDGLAAYTADWRPLDQMMVSDGIVAGSEVLVTSSAPIVDVVLQKHPWAGICAILLGDDILSVIDCFNPSTAIPHHVRVSMEPSKPLRIRPLGNRSPDSMGTQVIIEGFIEHGPQRAQPRYAKHRTVNRGGAFHPRFFEIAQELPSEAVILDIGGGKRQLPDERYINLEYSTYDEPDLFADGTALPFQTGSIDFIYSAAVLEHVTDPRLMGREIVRVLKPGGVALINSAFIQPIHSEGQHFFNATPYGLELALSGLEKRRSWAIGDLSSTLAWFMEVTFLNRIAPEQDLNEFMRIARHFDALIPPDRLSYIASGVWFEGIKPSVA